MVRSSTHVHRRDAAAGQVLPRILYVAGTGRSGSTLVGRILGEAPNAICVGETRYLWTRGLIHNVRCGCGEPFRSCSFWNAVGDAAFGGWDRLDPERLAELDRQTVRLRTLPLYGSRWPWRDFAAAVDEYVATLAALYGAIAQVSGAETVVDISKEPNFALLLNRMPASDIRLLHLVRDSRAVAYSWTRRKAMPSPIGGERFMPQFGPADQATRWLFWNVTLEALGRRHAHYMRIRYESFIAEPLQTLRALESLVEAQISESLASLADSTVKLGEHHMFSGNPMRARTGEVKMSLDDEWQRMMPRSHFAKVTAITWPQLRSYGYPIVPPERQRRGARRARSSSG